MCNGKPFLGSSTQIRLSRFPNHGSLLMKLLKIVFLELKNEWPWTHMHNHIRKSLIQQVTMNLYIIRCFFAVGYSYLAGFLSISSYLQLSLQNVVLYFNI